LEVCVDEILLFLALFHCVPDPAMTYVPGLDRHGYVSSYMKYTSHPVDYAILVHDLYMDCQGPARSFDEWAQKEQRAHRIETLWRRRRS
jgi:hypothetical protein